MMDYIHPRETKAWGASPRVLRAVHLAFDALARSDAAWIDAYDASKSNMPQGQAAERQESARIYRQIAEAAAKAAEYAESSIPTESPRSTSEGPP